MAQLQSDVPRISLSQLVAAHEMNNTKKNRIQLFGGELYGLDTCFLYFIKFEK